MEIIIYNNNMEHLIKPEEDIPSGINIPDVCQHKPSYLEDHSDNKGLQGKPDLKYPLSEQCDYSTDQSQSSHSPQSCVPLATDLDDCPSNNGKSASLGHNHSVCSGLTLTNSNSLEDNSANSMNDNHTSCTSGSCVPSEIDLSYSEERITLVTSQAFQARQNSLRLVSRSPRVIRRSTPFTEMDRKWALSQCEELTTWVNSVLRQKGQSLEYDLKKSISDGYTLPVLVGILSEDFQIPDKQAKNQQEQFERTRNCMQYLKDLGYDCTEVTALDIVNGDLKSVIVFLSGLKTFSEQNSDKQKSNSSSASEADEMSLLSSSLRARSRERVTPSTKSGDSGSISERLKRILKEEPPAGGVNVDNGEQENNDFPRGQPSGESDSAASPNSNNEDSLEKKVDAAYLKQQQQYSPHPQQYQQQYQQQHQQQQKQHQHQQHQLQHQGKQQPQQGTQPTQQGKQLQYIERPLTEMYSQSNATSSQQGHNNPHPRYNSSEMQTLPHARHSHEPVLYNKSVPNLHSYPAVDQVRAAPRSMTPTPGSSKLSVYNQSNHTHPKLPQEPSQEVEGTSKPGDRNSQIVNRHDNDIRSPGEVNSNQSIPKPDLYAPHTPQPRNCRTPYAQRRQLQLSATSHYETIDEVKLQPLPGTSGAGPGGGAGTGGGAGSTSTSTSSGTTSATITATTADHSRPQLPDYNSAVRGPDGAAGRRSQSEPSEAQLGSITPSGDGIPPDVKYDSTQRRRVSLPATRHRSTPKPKSTPPTRKSTPPTRKSIPVNHDLYIEPKEQLYNSDDDDDYVDISDNDDTVVMAAQGNIEHRASTPPLPSLMIDSETESCESDVQAEPTFKYRRSVSASPKMLSAGVNKFHQTVKQAKERSRANQLTEETGSTTELAVESTPSNLTKTSVKSGTKSNLVISPEYTVERGQVTSPTARADDPATHMPPGTSEQQRRRSDTAQRYRNSRGRRSQERLHDERGDDYQQYDSKIDRQVQKLERLYEDMSQYLTVSKQTGHRHRDTRRNSIASATSSQYSYSHRHRHSRGSSDTKAVQKRFARLEGHIFTIAKSISHLSSEMKSVHSLISEVERLSAELDIMKRQMSYHHHSNGVNTPHANSPPESSPQNPASSQMTIAENYGNGVGETTPHKISKLTRFFGQEPPLMKMFLKELGYEKYQPLFEAEKIGVMELPYMSEERLLSLGLPLGPCVRLLQEVSRFSSTSYRQRQNPTAGNVTASNRSSRHMS